MFWRRKSPNIHPASAVFVEQLRTFGPEHWAYALFESARIWQPGPVDRAGISAGIAADRTLAPLLAIFAKPDGGTRQVMAAVQAARQDSQIAYALAAFGDAAMDFKRGMDLLWLGDSLAQLAAVAVAHQDRLPPAVVERALAPFAQAVDVSSLTGPSVDPLPQSPS